MMIPSVEEIHGNGGQRLRVLAIVQFEEDESPFVAIQQVTGNERYGSRPVDG